MLGVRIGLRRILALYVQGLEAALERRLEHVGNAQPRLRVDGHAPFVAEQLARRGVGQVAVPGQLVRERSHVAGALDIVLAAQRVHAHAFLADVARGHREVRDAHDHGAALAVLGDAQAVVDGRIAARGVQPRRAAHQPRGNAGDGFHRLRRILRQRDEVLPLLERSRLAAGLHELLVHQSFGHDDMRQ